VEGDFRFEHEDDADGSTSYDIVGLARHDYTPRPEINSQSILNLTETKDSFDDGTDRLIRIAQLSNTSLWRPSAPRPLLITGGGFLTHIDDESFGRGRETTDTAQLNASANYQYSDLVNFYANTLNQYTKYEVQDDAYFHRLLAGANYRPRPVQFLGFVYGPAASGELENTLSDDEDQSQFSARTLLSHGLNRTWVGWGLTHSFSHAGDLEIESFSKDGLQSDIALNTDYTLSWLRAWGRANLSSVVGLSDQRRYILDEAEGQDESDEAFQELRFDLNGNYLIDRSQSLSGNMSITSRWAEVDSGTGDRQTASMFVNYSHQNLFNVPRLKFLSTVTATSDSYFFGYGEDEGDFLSWRNDIDFEIGRTTLEFDAEWIRTRGSDEFRIFLELVRRFGR
jgi:hypothetical protein